MNIIVFYKIIFAVYMKKSKTNVEVMQNLI